MQNIFGAGLLWGNQTQDADGNTVANSSSILFGVLQDVSIEVAFDQKMLYGSDSQFPKAIGNGKGKISVKAKYAGIRGDIFGSLFFGQAVSNGILSIVYDTVGSVIPATPFVVTPTPPSTGVFLDDKGVIFKAGFIPLKRVASAPVAGQYSVNIATGAYTFAAADTGKTVFISYKYTAPSTSAKVSTVIAKPMGYSPSFSLDLYVPYAGKSMIISLPKCISNKITFNTKLDDFAIQDFDCEAFQDDNGNIMTYATSE